MIDSPAQAQEVARDMPLWMIVLMIILCSFAGELYRLDQGAFITRQLFARAAIRAFVSTMIGVVALSYCLHKGMDMYAVGAITGGLALLGADLVITIGTVLIKRKLNVQ